MVELSTKLHPFLLRAYSWKHARKRVFSFAEIWSLRPDEPQNRITYDDEFRATHPEAMAILPFCVVCGSQMYKMRDLSQIPDVFPSIWVCEHCYQDGFWPPPCNPDKMPNFVKEAVAKVQPLADECYNRLTLSGKSRDLKPDLQCIKQCRFRAYGFGATNQQTENVE
jgi:hypothetical protein